MSEAARVASRAHKKPSNGHCLSSVNSEQLTNLDAGPKVE